MNIVKLIEAFQARLVYQYINMKRKGNVKVIYTKSKWTVLSNHSWRYLIRNYVHFL
jgi:hypothetical protein